MLGCATPSHDSEIVLRGSESDTALEEVARRALSVKPNFAYTLREVQEDVERVFATGYFATCTPEAEDTRDGVRLTINLEPNPELKVRANWARSYWIIFYFDPFGRSRGHNTIRLIVIRVQLRRYA